MSIEEIGWQRKTPGVDPAFAIRGGPNSEHFLSNLRKLLKRGKFFLTTQSLIVKRNWVYINKFIKTCFLWKKRLLTWYFFRWFLFKNKARGWSGAFEKGGGQLIWLDMVYFMIILVKRGSRKHSFVFNFQVKTP